MANCRSAKAITALAGGDVGAIERQKRG